MNNSIILSFILPCYNVSKYIEICLNSIFIQNFDEDEYEVICVNDCSTDNTEEIIKKLQNDHKNLVLVNQPQNKQQGAARNEGLRTAKGKFVWFIDADDYIQPDVLKDICSLAETNQLDILHFNAQRVDDEGNFQPYYASFPFDTDVITGIEYYEIDLPYWRRLIETWCRIYNREFLLRNNLFFPEGIYFEDAVYTVRSVMLSKRFKYLNKIVYNYRMNQDSSTMTKDISVNGKKMADLIRFHIDCISEMENHELNQGKKKEITGFYLNLFLRNRKNVFYLTNRERSIFYNRAKNIKFQKLDKFISPSKYLLYKNTSFIKLLLNLISPPFLVFRKLKRKLIA